MNIKPLADRVLVEPAAAETTASGIIIQILRKKNHKKERSLHRIGKRTDLTVKVGDTVLYGKYSGTELKLEGKDFLSCVKRIS